MFRNIKSLLTKISSNLEVQIRRSYSNYTPSSVQKQTNKEKELSQYIMVKATRDDYIPVLQVMHQAFYADEPACASLGIGPNPVMDERVIKNLTEGMSYLARVKNGEEIVGACINSTLYPWDPDQTEMVARSCKSPKLRTLLTFYAHITRRPDLWKSHSVKKVFEMCYLFVKPEHRRKGISLKLMQNSRKMAIEKGYKVIRCDATHFASGILCEKLGMKLVDEIPYSSYLGKDLVPIFQPLPPHEAVKIYVDVIEKNKDTK